jgi:hypothetical protein
MLNREFMLQDEAIFVINDQGDNIKLTFDEYEFEDQTL